MTWPPRWDGPQFKEPGAPSKVLRAQKRIALKAAEDKNKAVVRKRDKTCRFPLCGCRKFQLPLEVSHSQHKGAGGNPAGDRSLPELMIYLCRARHRQNSISIDRGTLRWVALTSAGADGRIHWLIDWHAASPSEARATDPKWVTLAFEIAPGIHGPFNPWQREMLHELADMAR